MMSIAEIKNYFDAVKRTFENEEDIGNAIDIITLNNWSTKEIDQINELKHFFWLDEDGPYSEFLNRGLKSLRPGFYLICGQPYYKDDISPGTYAADVLYFHPDYIDGELIKYEANIGPMTNILARYGNLPGTPKADDIEIRNQFSFDKQNIGSPEDHYLIPKRNFYNKIYSERKIFFVSESIYDPAYLHEIPKPKRVTWSFIDY